MEAEQHEHAVDKKNLIILRDKCKHSLHRHLVPSKNACVVDRHFPFGNKLDASEIFFPQINGLKRSILNLPI